MTNNHIKNINQQGGDKELTDQKIIKEYFKEKSQNDIVKILTKLDDKITEPNAKIIYNYFLNQTDNITPAC